MAEATIGEALSILSKVSVDVDKRLKFLESTIGKTIGAGAGEIFKPEPEEKKELVKKATPVIVTDFGRNAEKDLAGIETGGDGNEPDSEKKGGFNFIKKIIGPSLLILGGLAALVQGLMTDGPLKGFLNILAKTGIIGGVKLFASAAEKSFKSFGEQFAKILPTNLFKNVITSAKGFLGSIGSFLLAPFKRLAGQGGGKALFGTISKLFTKSLTPLLKRIPGIGSLISWGFAISRFKSGDLIGGLIDVASGIATLFPGIGTGISIGLDVLNAFLDVKKGKEEKIEPGGAPGGIGTFFSKIRNKIMDNFPMKNLMQFYSGVGKVFADGNYKEGFYDMAFALPFMRPLADFLFGSTDVETGEKTSPGFLGNIGAVLKSIKDKMLLKLLNLFPEKFGIRNKVAGLLGIDLGPDLSDPDQLKDARDARTKEIYGPYAGMSASQQILEEKIQNQNAKIDEANQRYAAMKEAKTVDDSIITKSGKVVIPDSQDTLYAMKDGGPLSKALNATPKMIGNLIDVEVDSRNLLKEQNLLLKSILEKTGTGSLAVANQSNQPTNFDQSGDAFRSLQMGY